MERAGAVPFLGGDYERPPGLDAIVIGCDDAGVEPALCAGLEPLGHALRVARSRGDILAAVSEPLSLVLLDVRTGFDGFDTAKLIRDRLREHDAPMLFLTEPKMEPEFHLRCFEAGAVDAVETTIDPTVLRSKVSVLLRLRSQAIALRRQARELSEHLAERERSAEALARRTAELDRSNAELESFVRIVTHHLEQPLHTLTGLTDLLRSSDSLGEQDREVAERVGSLAERLRARVGELLEYAKEAGPGPMMPVSLRQAFDMAVTSLAPAIADAGATVMTDDLPVVTGDLPQLHTLLHNLLDNAIKFSDHPPTVRISVERAGDDWIVGVADDGIGIAREHRARIFTIFQRLHADDRYSGSGVGLATAKKIVERHGGRIWVEDAPGGGSVVRVALPAVLDGQL